MSSVLGTYARKAISFKEGKGSYLYSENGEKYLDFVQGIATNILGHCHEHLVNTIQNQAQKLWHVSNAFIIPDQERLAKRLTDNTFADFVCFQNSGTEATEASIKIARKYFHKIGKPEKNRIITFQGAFHGRTFGSLSATSPKKYRYGFYPLTPGFKSVTFNDIDKLEALVKKDKKIAAIIVEPIQGEAGVKFSNKGFLKKIELICKTYNILFIVDEVQVGIGRTGKTFCHEHYNISPDIITLAKALGGGLPCGAMLVNPRFSDFLTPGSHGTTTVSYTHLTLPTKRIV